METWQESDLRKRRRIRSNRVSWAGFTSLEKKKKKKNRDPIRGTNFEATIKVAWSQPLFSLPRSNREEEEGEERRKKEEEEEEKENERKRRKKGQSMFERIVNTIFFFFLLQHGGTRLSDFYFYIELKAIKVCERLIKLCLRGEVWIEDPG